MTSGATPNAPGEEKKSPSRRSGELTPEELETLNEALPKALGQRYEVVSRLGTGAFGEVFKARDRMLDREVAVKRIRLEVFEDDETRDDARKRFLREAKLAAKLNHPNIVTIYDVVDTPIGQFIIMEFIDGHTLSDELRRRSRLTLNETINILSQAADALDYAHSNTIVHRDVKPANIMIKSTGGVKVADFGTAKSETSSNITSTGTIVGTPEYMSPEQARGQIQVDGRSDLFSLGCILYECLSGAKPFRADTTVATLIRIVNDDPPEVNYEMLGLHVGLGDAIGRALAKEPAKRFTTAGELIEALRAVPAIEAPQAAQDNKDVDAEVAVPPRLPVTRREPGTDQLFDQKLQGSLKQRALPEVIREVYVTRRTGILYLEHEGVSKRIYFEKGSIVFANSDVINDRLGELLIRSGEIDRTVFDQASAIMQETGQRLGRTLVELSHSNEEKIESMVTRQIEAIIYSLFDWNAGYFRFEQLEQPVEKDITVSLSTADIMLEGIRRMDSPGTVRGGLGNLGRVLCHSENPLLLYQKISLTPEEGFVLSRADGTTTIAEAVTISPLAEDETLRCIYGLVSAGVLELQEKAQNPTTRLRHRESEPVKLPSPRPDIKKAAPKTKTAESKPTAQQRKLNEKIAAKHASLPSATQYELLEIAPQANEAEIKKAYFAMIKEYHPDRHHSPHLENMRGLLEELVVKITAAYETLSNPEQRKRYDLSLSGSSAAPGSDSPRPPTTGYGAAARAPDPATPPSPPPPLAADAPGSSMPLTPGTLAEIYYRDGKRRFHDMAYYDAIQCLREAVRLDPVKARYHRLLAQVLRKNPNWRSEAQEHFMEAVKLDALDSESHLGLAVIYEELGMTALSLKMYQKTLELDPGNDVANEKIHGKKKSRSFGILRDMLKKKTE